jgi:hypothetical protein
VGRVRSAFGALIQQREPVPDPPTYGPTGWAPFAPLATPNVQKGAFGDRLLNQYPAIWPGLQRKNGRQGNNPGWVVLRTYAVNPEQASQFPANASQTQRYGNTYTGGMGPIAAQALAQRVADGQVRQSGVNAVNYAAALAGR